MEKEIDEKVALFWRDKCGMYEFLYKEQKHICDGYRNLIHEYKEELKKAKQKLMEK